MERDELEDEDKEYNLHKVTASAYEAQDYSDSGEYLVEPVAMPPTGISFCFSIINKNFNNYFKLLIFYFYKCKPYKIRYNF